MNELYHYGIPRRSGRYPWGSGKNPYQGDIKSVSQRSYALAQKGKKRTKELQGDHIIDSNTTLYRSTTNPNEKINGSLYTTYLNIDRNLYKGGYIRERDNKKESFETSFKSNKDLKVAGRETIQDSVKELIKDKQLLKDSVNSYLNMVMPKNSDLRWYIDHPNEGPYDAKAFDRYVEKSLGERYNQPVKEQFGSLMASLGTANKFKNALIKDLQSKGYDAMTDEAGVKGFGINIEGIDPLLIFDSKNLQKIGFRSISPYEEKSSMNEYLKWQRKAISKKREW